MDSRAESQGIFSVVTTSTGEQSKADLLLHIVFFSLSSLNVTTVTTKVKVVVSRWTHLLY